jgi:hypothetical protein
MPRCGRRDIGAVVDERTIDALIPGTIAAIAILSITILAALNDPIPPVLLTLAGLFPSIAIAIAAYYRYRGETPSTFPHTHVEDEKEESS